MLCALGRRANTTTTARNRLAPNGIGLRRCASLNSKSEIRIPKGFAGERNVGEARAAARRTPSRDKDKSGDARAECYMLVFGLFLKYRLSQGWRRRFIPFSLSPCTATIFLFLSLFCQCN